MATWRSRSVSTICSPSFSDTYPSHDQGFRMNVRRRLPIIAFGLLLGLLFGEIALRIVAPVKASDLLPLAYDRAGLERIAAQDTYIAFDPSLGWTISRSTSRPSNQAVYTSNSSGMRSSR